MPLSQDLLEHATSLLRSGNSNSEVTLRRSISSSYYSAWHSVCAAIASKFHEDLRHGINRHPAHTGAKIAARKMLANKGFWHSGNCSDEMNNFCEQFLRLQNLRLKADYDTQFNPRMQDAMDAYNYADGIKSFIEHESGNCPHFDSFVLQCLEVKFKRRDS